ncbi:MAG: hypothetical protein COC05_03205 [Gammaproteobacteria bacterium]|nr:MAG: hypothetical protein COC05_03205 [Gammaproteobacteria bacterium]
MDNLVPYSKTFWVSLIAGVTTGMGNGSVFGAALMCALGRGRFDDWGGWGGQIFDPTTFMGFMNWCMIVFGFAFMAIMMIATSRHGALEAQARAAA